MTQIYNQYVNFIKMCDNYRYREAEELLKDIIVDVLGQNATQLLRIASHRIDTNQNQYQYNDNICHLICLL